MRILSQENVDPLERARPAVGNAPADPLRPIPAAAADEGAADQDFANLSGGGGRWIVLIGDARLGEAAPGDQHFRSTGIEPLADLARHDHETELDRNENRADLGSPE